jgi:hypothetical protein
MAMRQSANAVVIFLVAGLIGPLIYWIMWPPIVFWVSIYDRGYAAVGTVNPASLAVL